jgi:hypothetical protein
MTIALENVTQSAFDLAEETVIALVREAYPSLDLRRGTVIRELLVRPGSAFYALESDRYDQLQQIRSLQSIADNPGAATTDDVNHLLANFNLTMRAGAAAYGTARIKVQYDRSYLIPATFVLEASGGVQYGVEQAYNVSSTASTDSNHIQLIGPDTDQSYHFLLQVVASATGDDGTVTAGTALDAVAAFDGFITADAYTDFTGGTDSETVEAIIARLPSAISHRSMSSRSSIEAILRSPDDGGFSQILSAISILGYGDVGQLRDKHNASGVATGGKTDVYVRTFRQPATVVLEKTGTLIDPHTYQIVLNRDEAPGFYAVRTVTDAGVADSALLDFETLPAIGSYDLTDTRGTSGITSTIHDIDPQNAVIETSGTVFQTSTLVVNHVSTAAGDTHDFRVELYVAPELAAIQDYVDRTDVRSIKSDILVRCPAICLVGMRATVTPSVGVTLDVQQLRNAIVDYVNDRSFVTELTESELLGVLHTFDITRVDTSQDASTGFELQGIVRDAAGTVHTLRGHSLSIAAVADASTLLLPSTCVFAAHTDDITINVSST